RGAMPAQVARLQDLAQIPLPDEYQQFLTVMGEDAAWMTFPYENKSPITSLIDYYAAVRNSNRLLLPPDCLQFTTGGIDITLSLQIRPDKTPTVIFNEGSKVFGPCSELLTKLIFRQA